MRSFLSSALVVVVSLSAAHAFLAPANVDVLTFNIRFDTPRDGKDAWPMRREMVGQWLKRNSPDIIGLQEALRHQIDDIRRAVPEYDEFGVGRDDGKNAGEHCTILYKRDRFEIDDTDCGTFWLSDTPEVAGSRSWGNGITRICTWARFHDKKSKKGLYVYNTHWDHRSQSSREKSAELVVERVSARKRTEDPVILLGDFNAAEDNKAIATLTNGDLKFIDTFRFLSPDDQAVRTAHGFRGETVGKKIDHIFILPATAEIKSAEIIRYHEDDRYLSDHYPVRAVLRFANESVR